MKIRNSISIVSLKPAFDHSMKPKLKNYKVPNEEELCKLKCHPVSSANRILHGSQGKKLLHSISSNYWSGDCMYPACWERRQTGWEGDELADEMHPFSTLHLIIPWRVCNNGKRIFHVLFRPANEPLIRPYIKSSSDRDMHHRRIYIPRSGAVVCLLRPSRPGV